MNTILKISLIILQAALVACNSNPQAKKDKNLVDSLTRDFTLALNSRDVNRLLNYFADDAIFISCGWRMGGKDSIASGLKFLLEHSSDLKIYPGTSSVSDEIVFTQGLITFKWVNESYSAIAKGIMILVWKKQKDGSWKITFEEENHGDLPEK